MPDANAGSPQERLRLMADVNAMQFAGETHPYTCGNEHEKHVRLVFLEDGWHCPVDFCDWFQPDNRRSGDAA